MKICVAQTKSFKGDIKRNIINHKNLIELAVSFEANIIIFPELSLTGYEPELAHELATHQDDFRFEDFQKISNEQQIIIGVGVPVKNNNGINIGMVLFQPNQTRQTYSKRFLHADEEGFFISGSGISGLKLNETTVALAICYEISVPEHAENAFKGGAAIYIASVAKFVNGIEKAISRLSEIAKKYSMTVLMSNCVGQSDGNECAGKTSIWNPKGVLLGQLNNMEEGILIFDTEKQELIERIL